MSNPFDLVHFDTAHSIFGPISPESVLKRELYSSFISKIFHIEYSDFYTEFERKIDPDTHVSELRVIQTPVLFGIRLTSLQIVLKAVICPPVYMFSFNLPKFPTVQSHMLSTYVSLGPMKALMVNQVYHCPNFVSKLFARINFSAIPQAV